MIEPLPNCEELHVSIKYKIIVLLADVEERVVRKRFIESDYGSNGLSWSERRFNGRDENNENVSKIRFSKRGQVEDAKRELQKGLACDCCFNRCSDHTLAKYCHLQPGEVKKQLEAFQLVKKNAYTRYSNARESGRINFLTSVLDD